MKCYDYIIAIIAIGGLAFIGSDKIGYLHTITQAGAFFLRVALQR
jgi:hypothetical protein